MINQPLEVEPIPPEVRFGEYIPYEKKDMEREVDAQKKLDDPEFQGAFHVRKKNSEKKKPQPKKARPNTSNRR
jgi:ATP-dependent RNA helicase RhlE